MIVDAPEPDANPAQGARPSRGNIYAPERAGEVGWWGPLVRGLHALGWERERVANASTVRVGRLLHRFDLHRNLRRGGRAVLHPAAWASTSRLFPRGLWHEPVVLAMDCWACDWDRWEGLLHRHRVRAAAFTARDSEAEMRRRLPGLETMWLPEGIDEANYSNGGPLAQRSIDLLEMGRKYAAFHDAVREPLRVAGVRHDHAGDKYYIYNSHEQIRAAIADAKLLVCYPRSDTKPWQAGAVETLTLRYLEGLVSGCLLVGRAPQELVDLFGYDPVVPFDPATPNPGARLLELIRSVDQFQEQVDRNRERALEVGPWSGRARELTGWLQRLGYGFPSSVPDLSGETPGWRADLLARAC